MKNKKAIEILKPLTECSVDDNGIGTFPMVSTPLQVEALNLAIKALEEQERPTGEWIFGGVYRDENNPIDSDIYYCSICKRSIITTLTRPTDLFPFCHCGAKMKEAEDEQVR